MTREMTASFGGIEVHPTLSTVTMVYYMEWVGRNIILPFLEKGEEGVGGAITVKHRAPAPVGKQVTFTAEATEVKTNQVVCRVEARHDKAVVGEGTFVQAILLKQQIRDRIEEMK
ncbi:putative thioesterase [Melghirimyces profundicolus]|uniref:Putative thioesterase n=1 Tax=Melghirimyces profundicolus TaxID=1242148 RepID=A0A2T6C4X0_9BACL|nr:putative thioesterase [Melghirimyces profundicolus]